jgi:hypothetical protein
VAIEGKSIRKIPVIVPGYALGFQEKAFMLAVYKRGKLAAIVIQILAANAAGSDRRNNILRNLVDA